MIHGVTRKLEQQSRSRFPTSRPLRFERNISWMSKLSSLELSARETCSWLGENEPIVVGSGSKAYLRGSKWCCSNLQLCCCWGTRTIFGGTRGVRGFGRLNYDHFGPQLLTRLNVMTCLRSFWSFIYLFMKLWHVWRRRHSFLVQITHIWWGVFRGRLPSEPWKRVFGWRFITRDIDFCSKTVTSCWVEYNNIMKWWQGCAGFWNAVLDHTKKMRKWQKKRYVWNCILKTGQ